MKFKEFVIKENAMYFGQKVSNILSAMQDLNETLSTMGTKHIVSNSQNIVNQIRRIIHTKWSDKEERDLLVLQRCAVSIMRAIEEKDDLKSILQACEQQIEEVLSRYDVANNNIKL